MNGSISCDTLKITTENNNIYVFGHNEDKLTVFFVTDRKVRLYQSMTNDFVASFNNIRISFKKYEGG